MAARVDPPLQGTEADQLLAYLDYHRDTLRAKVAGLSQHQTAQALAPSTMTLGGLVKHLDLVEDHWFSVVLADNPPAAPWDAIDWDDDPDWEWRTGATEDPDVLLASYDATVARVDANIRSALERGGTEVLAAKPNRRTGESFNLRWVLLHMIEEYARHNGHADLIRESIDGEVGE